MSASLVSTRVENLAGIALAWAVAQVRGADVAYSPSTGLYQTGQGMGLPYRPDKSWAIAGKLIDEMQLSVFPMDCVQHGWCAHYHEPVADCLGRLKVRAYAATPLDAVCLCYLLATAGEVIEVPDNILEAQ